jgi:ankyrin repeat protein
LNPNQYLPKTRNNAQDLDMNAVYDLSHQNNQLKFLKLAVKLLSDNADVPELKSAIVELAQDSRVLSALRRLLDQKLLSVEAFAEKLLIPAIEAGNKTLVEMLLDAGVSIDMEGSPSLALWCAIELGQTELVGVLLNHGANASVDLGRSYKDYNTKWIRNQCRECESFLDVAVALGKVDIVMAIITPNPCRQATPPTTLHTLFHAASLSMPDVLLRLLSADPAAVELMKLDPYIMISGAARGGSVAVFTELRKHGLDFDVTVPIEGTPDLGKITALAEACYRGHKPLVEYLLSEGANAEGRVHSLYTLPPLFAALWSSQKGITLSGRILPSHWPVGSDHHYLSGYNSNKNRDVVRLLLDHDANPSTSWGGYYAIHIAAAHHNGNSSHDTAITTTNITALQKAGADINISNEYDDRQAIDFALPFGSTGSTEIVHTLLRMGATLDHKDALKSVFLTGNRELVDMVLEKMPRGSGDSSSLEACITIFGCELARDLLENSTFDQAKDLNSPGVIYAAVEEGDEEFVRMCCEIEGPSHDHMTSALALAAQLQNVAMIQLLLEVGAKPYIPLTLLRTLHTDGMRSRHLPRGTDALNELFVSLREDFDDHDCERLMQATKLLIHACEGEPDHVDEEKMRRSSLRRFFRNSVQSAPLAIVRMLIDSGFSIYESYDSLQSPLQWALEGERRSTAVFLLEHGSTPDWLATVVHEDVRNHRPIHTALQYAVQQNLTSMTKSLLDKKVDVNAEPAKFRGATAFQYCAINSNFEIASMLLQANADINAPPAFCNGRTAIEGAAEHGRLNMVKFLLVAGADIRGRNNKNYARTIYRAWANGHSTILKMIQEFKRDRFGPDDVESIKVIVQSMTQNHLDFWDLGEEATWPEIFAAGRNSWRIGEIVQEWVD